MTNGNNIIKLNGNKSITFELQAQRIPEPLVRFETPEIASLNDALGKYGIAQRGFIKKWRKKGRDLATSQALKNNLELDTWTEYDATETGRIKEVIKKRIVSPLPVPVTLVLRFWRPTWRAFDTFNPLLKPMTDGFVDAGLLVDDSMKYLDRLIVEFMGVDKSLEISKEAQADRKLSRRLKGKKFLTVSRFWFDFYPSEKFVYEKA